MGGGAPSLTPAAFIHVAAEVEREAAEGGDGRPR